MKNLIKSLNKIPTLLMLVLSIVMSVPVNVFADTLASDTTGKATVTIKGIDKKYEDSVTVSAYKIIDTNVEAGSPKSPVYTWNTAVASWVADKYPQYIDTKNNAVKAEFCDEDSNTNQEITCITADDVATFYDELAKAIGNKDAKINGGSELAPTATANHTNENADGDIELTLGMGNYLILIANGVNIYKPSAVNVVPTYDEEEGWIVEDSEITVKYETPSITKTANTDQAGIGDPISFTITVTIPEYPANAIHKTVKISDKFISGLAYKTGSVVVKTDGREVSSNNYTLNETATDDFDFQIVFSDEQYETALRGKSTITVEYVGIVTKDASVVDPATNQAKLEYNNNPYINDSFEEDEITTVTIYTYGIKLSKVNKKDNEEFLPGAKFKVYESENSNEAMKFVEVSEGVYRKAITADITDEEGNVIIEKDTNTVDELTVGEGDDNKGILVIEGLAEGTYWLEETAAPEGYVILQDRFDVTITAISDKTGKTGIVDDDDDEDGLAAITVENSKDIITLPVTGGIGTLLFSVIGILFMGLGAFLIKNILKKESVQ